MHVRLFSLLFLAYLMTGCALFSNSGAENDEDDLTRRVAQYPAPDPEIKSMLSAYRDSLDEVMGRTIAEVTDTIRFGQPESPLGNIVADALRFRASGELRTFINVGIIGQDSFRIYFEPGTLTKGDVYEFMPYENHLVVLTLSGEMLKELAGQIAVTGGSPVSGLRFRLDDGKASGVLVNAEVIDPGRHYLVATSNYMADGGGRFPALWKPLHREDLEVSIRDLYIDYFRNKRELSPVTDGRIRQ
ncbi:MAG: 5'-nucleotidase [Balneolaceae bacterium]